MDSRNESNRFGVLMLPWLAHGHISPFLELAKRLTNHNFQIYLCSTPINLNYINKNLSQKYSQSIKLVELHLHSSPDLPPHYHTTNGLPPHLMKTLKVAYEKSSPVFTTIIRNLSPDLLIYDFNQWWAAAAASSLKIPSVQFLTGAAVTYSVALHYFTKPLAEKYPFPEIYLKDHELIRMREALASVSMEDLKTTDPLLESIKRSSGIVLIKSIRELDGKYIDYLSQIVEKKVVPIGPLIQESSEEDDDDEHSDIIRWLDKKEDSSVVFVSFGSEYFLSNNEIEDIAYGLELSNVSFIWVIRFPEGKKTRIQEVLPDGFLERLGERGMVMGKWAPQAKILSHSSTGGFVSHCGWGSVMESIRYGVPIIAMPMQLDQPYNARLVAELGVGIDVGRGRDGRLKREEMAEVVRKVVVEEGGGSMREKAVELSEIIREKGNEEIDSVVMENLIKLCELKS